MIILKFFSHVICCFVVAVVVCVADVQKGSFDDSGSKSGKDLSRAPTIHDPGPDTVNFPTSPYTLPKGRAYVENFPLGWQLEGNDDPAVYNWSFLFRYGLTDDIEFRVLGNGLTKVYQSQDSPSRLGFSPLIIGCKIHLSGKEEILWIPGFGVEFYVQTTAASDFLKAGTQPIVNFLFKHTFPHEWDLEWNAGMFGRQLPGPAKRRNLYGLIEWALEKSLNHNFLILTHGYYGTPCEPYFSSQLVAGIGFEVTPTDRTSVYGNVNWSLLSTGNPVLVYVGCAFAF